MGFALCVIIENTTSFSRLPLKKKHLFHVLSSYDRNSICIDYIKQSTTPPPPSQKKGVRYPPISEPLIYYGFDLVRWCNFKSFWLSVKQVLYINKNLKHSSRFSAFSLVSCLLLYLSTSFAHCFVCLFQQNPQIR